MICLFNIAVSLGMTSATRKGGDVAPDRPSFETIYSQEFAFAWRTMRALGVNSAIIDDAVQDVFIIVHRRLDDYRPEASLRSWVFGIVRRVAHDYRRSDKRRGQQIPLDENVHARDGLDPYRNTAKNQALKAVEEFADTLDEERRAIFVLSELEEMPVGEIAAMLGLNQNTVYSRLRVIRENLSKFFSERFGGTQGEFYE